MKRTKRFISLLLLSFLLFSLSLITYAKESENFKFYIKNTCISDMTAKEFSKKYEAKKTGQGTYTASVEGYNITIKYLNDGSIKYIKTLSDIRARKKDILSVDYKGNKVKLGMTYDEVEEAFGAMDWDDSDYTYDEDDFYMQYKDSKGTLELKLNQYNKNDDGIVGDFYYYSSK